MSQSNDTETEEVEVSPIKVQHEDASESAIHNTSEVQTLIKEEKCGAPEGKGSFTYSTRPNAPQLIPVCYKKYCRKHFPPRALAPARASN